MPEDGLWFGPQGLVDCDNGCGLGRDDRSHGVPEDWLWFGFQVLEDCDNGGLRANDGGDGGGDDGGDLEQSVKILLVA